MCGVLHVSVYLLFTSRPPHVLFCTQQHQLEERKQEFSQLPAEQRHKAKEEIQNLRHKRDTLHAERQAIDSKLHDGKILSDQEERR
jgi:hypothetical protein